MLLNKSAFGQLACDCEAAWEVNDPSPENGGVWINNGGEIGPDDACWDIEVIFNGLVEDCGCDVTSALVNLMYEGELIQLTEISPPTIRDLFMGQIAVFENLFREDFWTQSGITSTLNPNPNQIGIGESFTFDIWIGAGWFPLQLITNLDCDGDGEPDCSLSDEILVYSVCI